MIKAEDIRHGNGTIVRGKIISPDEISLKIIGERKMCFETSLLINTNSICKVELINHYNEKKKLTGEAISSVLKRVQAENGDHVPIYEVWLKFTELNDIEKQFLDKLKNELTSEAAAF
ncbi:MAG: hypothetical protein ACXAES_16875 [Promethearchaeota archaeon]|jgi:hypothetical protein